ncbi:MAG: tetratricopeptide repeat protein [Spirochaetes bacterium]|nr:tetratricopeptide repeat protein [Spirochaetota bacterium]
MTNFFLITLLIIAILFILYIRYFLVILLTPKRLTLAQKMLDHHPEKAIQILSRILATDRGNPHANWIMAHLYLKKKQYVLAEMYLHDILHYSSSFREITEQEIRETLAHIYYKMGDMQKALAQYYLLRKHNTLSVKGMKNAIRILVENNDLISAKKLLLQAIEAFEDDGELYYLYGLLEFRKGDFKAAETQLRLASKMYVSPEVDFLLGKTYFITKKFSQALEHLQKLPEEYLRSSEVEGLVGQSFYYLKNYSSAIRTLEELTNRLKQKNKKNSFLADVMYILGCAYEASGNIKKAMKLWTIIQVNFPFNQMAKEKIYFYTRVVTKKKLQEFILSPFGNFIKISEKLIDVMDYSLKEQIYEDEKNLDYLCIYRKDLHPFFHYLVHITRQTAIIDVEYINKKLLLLSRFRAKYLIIVAPYLSDTGIQYAQKNSIFLYDYQIFLKSKLL